jgi:hypothetical protein
VNILNRVKRDPVMYEWARLSKAYRISRSEEEKKRIEAKLEAIENQPEFTVTK